eukprot:1179691-Prorocentrum_minimum.AAC.3
MDDNRKHTGYPNICIVNRSQTEERLECHRAKLDLIEIVTGLNRVLCMNVQCSAPGHPGLNAGNHRANPDYCIPKNHRAIPD